MITIFFNSHVVGRYNLMYEKIDNFVVSKLFNNAKAQLWHGSQLNYQEQSWNISFTYRDNNDHETLSFFQNVFNESIANIIEYVNVNYFVFSQPLMQKKLEFLHFCKTKNKSSVLQAFINARLISANLTTPERINFLLNYDCSHNYLTMRA